MPAALEKPVIATEVEITGGTPLALTHPTPHPPQTVGPADAKGSGGVCISASPAPRSPDCIPSTKAHQTSHTRASHAHPDQPAATKSRIPVTELRVKDTHRLIASKYSETGTVLSRLSADASTLSSLLELDDATNDRFLGEEGLLPGIGIHELVYGIRYAHIVNAAFTHPSPTGGRFNSATRGAWYASLDRPTSIAEVAFHKLRQLEEIDWPHEEISTSDDYLADITSPFHDLRDTDLRDPDLHHPVGSTTNPGAPPSPASSERVGSATNVRANPADPESASISGSPSSAAVSHPVMSPASELHNPFARYLRPDPIPRCYARPQRLADRLIARKSNGIIYPSVRRPGGTCLAVFRPALVYNVRRGSRLELRLQPNRPFRLSHARELPIPKG